MTATLFTAPPKYPEEFLDYSVDWASRLLAGESIATHTATVTRGSAILSNESMLTATKQVFWLSGGVALEDTLVLAKIVTDAARPRTHEVLVRVRIAAPGP